MPKDNQSLYERAVAYLLQMPKTEQQLRQWYARKTTDQALIEEQIVRLKESNLLNDAAYAVAYVQSKQDKIGVNLIKYKLRLNGVAPDLIDQAINQIIDQHELVKLQMDKYLRHKERTPATKAKLVRWLLARGFSMDLCREIIDENWH